MSQSIEDVRKVVGILGPSLDSTVVHEDFGTVVVRLEARDVSDTQLTALQSFANEVGLRNAGASISFDAVSKRIYYSVGDAAFAGVDSFRSALKQAGIRVINGR